MEQPPNILTFLLSSSFTNSMQSGLCAWGFTNTRPKFAFTSVEGLTELFERTHARQLAEKDQFAHAMWMRVGDHVQLVVSEHSQLDCERTEPRGEPHDEVAQDRVRDGAVRPDVVRGDGALL